jgi:heat-inducible transcriptional repressor
VETEHPLDERKEQILREIIEAYVRLGEPVGSRVVADGTDLGVSSATVRNEMGILEREGYISHPHTSAGRIPTDKGYRYYVDVLAPKVATDPDRRREIEHFLAGAVSALDELLERASQVLVDLTDYTSLAARPPIGESTLARIELVKLSGPRVLLVCVGDEGWHEDRLLELSEEPTDEVVRRVVEIAAPLVSSRSLIEAAEAIHQAGARTELALLIEAVSEGLLAIARTTGRVVTGGASKLVVWEPPPTAARVLEMLEAGSVESLLAEPRPDRVTVRIGRELAIGDLRDLSLIATGYRFGRRAGTLGVLGPTRMDYPAVISTVAEVASTLSRVLRQLDS